MARKVLPDGLLRTSVLVLLSFSLFRCERTATFNPKPPEKAEFRGHHLGTYSTKLAGEEEKEIQGTIFEATLSFSWEKAGNGYVLHRKADTVVARGYHKFSFPLELERKLEIAIRLDSALRPDSVSGYDSARQVFGRIDQRDEYRKQLLKDSDPARLRAWARDWWRLCRFLPVGTPIEARKPLSVEAINKTLETLQADSARFDGPRPRMKKACLDYTLYYHRTDSLPLMVEQFWFSSLQNRKYRRHVWKPGIIKGWLQFSVDRDTGLPCFISRTEAADILLERKEEKSEVPIQLFRYEEDIYGQ